MKNWISLERDKKNGRTLATIVVLLSVSFSYVFLDFAYRIYIERKLFSEVFAFLDARMPRKGSGATEKHFDPWVGIRYSPNFEGSRGAPWHSSFRTNSHGHIASADYPLKKPEGEFRIAFVGDSFTANVTNNVRWVELLEQALNSDPQWRAFTKSPRTRVINMGVDGIGFAHFEAWVDHEVDRFEPDMVVLNFVTLDFFRKFYVLNAPPTLKYDTPKQRTEVLRKITKDVYFGNIDFRALYPELLATTIGKYFGLMPRIPWSLPSVVSLASGSVRLGREEGRVASLAQIRGIIAARPAIVFMYNPLMHEIKGQYDKNGKFMGTLGDLVSAVKKFRPINMLCYLGFGASPKNSYVTSYFPVGDGHYNDRGVTRYAAAAHKALLDWVNNKAEVLTPDRPPRSCL